MVIMKEHEGYPMDTSPDTCIHDVFCEACKEYVTKSGLCHDCGESIEKEKIEE